MNLLKLAIPSGYKMLEPGFAVNFLTKTRVDPDADNADLLKLAEGLYLPIETLFVGKNSSGKTTTLEAIYLALYFLVYGRIPSKEFAPGDRFSIEVVFFQDDCIYSYSGQFIHSASIGSEYLTIEGESLGRTKYRRHYGKDLSKAAFFQVPDFKPAKGTDTSSVTRYCQGASVFLHSGNFHYGTNLHLLLSSLAKEFKPEAIDRLVHLFDDSIEYIRLREEESNKGSYAFKRLGCTEIVVDGSYLESHLSNGTKKGLWLYGFSMYLFRIGGYLIVDEIERSFHKNLIGNLVLMFNDPSINVHGASLIYSTHYSELLDQSSRCDNINVLHRDGCIITVKNMSADYKVRTDLVRSAQFDENVFDNLLNYDRLIALKGVLREE